MKALSVLLAALLAGCVSGRIQVRSTTGPGWTAEPHHSYAWISESDVGGGDMRRAQVARWIRDAVEQNLAARGYVKQSKQAASFLVDYSFEIRATDVSSFRGFAQYKEQGGEKLLSEAYTSGYVARSLQIDFRDIRNAQTLWSASATTASTVEVSRQLIEEAVSQMLGQLPDD